MEAMALEVLARLQLRGDELVLDAGCGSGRVTEALLTRLPRGRVIAVDMSPSMLSAASERLAAQAQGDGRLQLLLADLLELDLPEPVDAIFSTATFHWIGDHERLFHRLRTLLARGGQLVAQCGGEGNIDVLRGRARAVEQREPYAEHFREWRPPWNYAAPERTRERLLRADFANAECWLQPVRVQPQPPREFLATIVLGPHVQRLPVELREPFMDEVLAELGEPVVVDYVRLNISASA
jgi:trans-aconitate 2-methyltransferase